MEDQRDLTKSHIRNEVLLSDSLDRSNLDLGRFPLRHERLDECFYELYLPSRIYDNLEKNMNFEMSSHTNF